jgi:hypothetical protein
MDWSFLAINVMKPIIGSPWNVPTRIVRGRRPPCGSQRSLGRPDTLKPVRHRGNPQLWQYGRQANLVVQHYATEIPDRAPLSAGQPSKPGPDPQTVGVDLRLQRRDPTINAAERVA